MAIDVCDLSAARKLARLVVDAGACLVEVGDPLIKRWGMQAVSDIRSEIPGNVLVAEFASSDWIDEQIQMASASGANVVQVIGLKHEARIKRAVHAARNNRVSIFAAYTVHDDTPLWCKIAQQNGVDGVAIVRNIDTFHGNEAVLQALTAIGAEIHVPVAVSGGFTPYNIEGVLPLPWHILIVGSAIVDSPRPGEVARLLAARIAGSGHPTLHTVTSSHN